MLQGPPLPGRRASRQVAGSGPDGGPLLCRAGSACVPRPLVSDGPACLARYHRIPGRDRRERRRHSRGVGQVKLASRGDHGVAVKTAGTQVRAEHGRSLLVRRQGKGLDPPGCTGCTGMCRTPPENVSRAMHSPAAGTVSRSGLRGGRPGQAARWSPVPSGRSRSLSPFPRTGRPGNGQEEAAARADPAGPRPR